MNFNLGDHVVHQSFGVGTVVSIEGMNFGSNQSRLFYRVEFLRTIIWVPVGTKPSGGLRPITSNKSLYLFRDLLKSSPVRLDANFRIRQKELENRIHTGTFQSLCEIVRDLSAWEMQKPLNHYEKTLLKQSRASLATEWSETSGLEVREAMVEIEGCLLKGKQERGIS